MSSEFGVSCSENSEKSSEKVVGGWVGLERHRGVQRYPVWYISGIEQAQKRGQDNASANKVWLNTWEEGCNTSPLGSSNGEEG